MLSRLCLLKEYNLCQDNLLLNHSIETSTVHMLKKLLDEAKQNIVICQWRADQLFAEAGS